MSWGMFAEIMLYCLLIGGGLGTSAGALVWTVILVGERLVYRFV